MSVSTHVLDAANGRPAVGVQVELHALDPGEPLVTQVTNEDGRVLDFGSPSPGTYTLTFGTGAYFAAQGVATFYPRVVVAFEIIDAEAHHHVPLLLSPFAYSTYRGN